MVLVGLTGNFGMGKSLALSFFEKLGAAILSSDQIVHGLLHEKKVKAGILKIFGPEAKKTDGDLDRKFIADTVFQNEELRLKLEGLLHPLVFNKIARFVSKVRKSHDMAVIEVPLLFESKRESGFDKTVTIFCSRKTAIERLACSGYSRKDALQRLKAQTPIRIKKKLADYVIDNNGRREETFRQVRTIYKLLKTE